MVCRENPASSIAIALARSGSWLDDAQVQSVVHRLRHEFSGHQPPPGWDRATYLTQQLDRASTAIERNPNFRRDRRAGLRRRLTRAREQTGALRDDMLWAMARLPDGVAAAQAALDTRLGEIAGRRGMSLREARAEFLAARAEAPEGRQPRASAAELRDLGALPSDPATRYALQTMGAAEPVLPPVRLVQRWLPVTARDDDEPAATEAGLSSGTGGEAGIGVPTQIGVSALSDRVEIRRSDGSTLAYRLPREHIDRLLEQARREPLDQAAVDAVERRGTRIARAEQSAYAVRCDECGEFVGDRWHDCPMRGPVALVARLDHLDGTSRLSAPDPADVARLIAANHDRPVQAPIHHLTGDADVEGTVLLRPGLTTVRGLDRTSRQVVDLDDAAPGELTCRTCQDTQCRHVSHTRQAIRDHLRRAGQLPQTEVSTFLHTQGVRTRPRPTRDQPQPDAPSPAVSFLSNPEAFRQAIRDSGPDRTVPFHTENALQGYAAGTRFGIEIEFDADSTTVPDAVAHDLHTGGLLASPRQQQYHAGFRGGYQQWVFERDGSVGGGELVTPVLSDTAEHWGQLAAACAAIRRHGGTTDRAGSHTNIAASGYTPAMAWRLVNLIQSHEDDIYRMGRTRGSVRLEAYNRPLNGRDPGPEWTASYQPTQFQPGRESMINFYQAFQGGTSRIEWRFPDASHDPGVIQAQVNFCAAMTNYVRTNDVPPGVRRPLHSARRGGWARNLMVADPVEFEERTRPVRGLIDTLFHTDRERTQIAALWGRGSYYR